LIYLKNGELISRMVRAHRSAREWLTHEGHVS
jgi:hypothetical protein